MMLPRALSLAALPLLASANCPDLGIAAEVACLTSDNTMSATPSFLASGASCPEACTTAWNALIATCPLGTDDWDLDDGATGTAGVAAGWVDMDGEATDANAINVGDAQSVAARIAVKWLALGLDKELCAWANPATNVKLDTCGHAQRIMQCVAPLALPLSLICPAADAARLRRYTARGFAGDGSTAAWPDGDQTAYDCTSDAASCSTECRALADAALGAGADVSADGIGVPTGAGTCCPEGSSATHPTNCTGEVVSHGDSGARPVLFAKPSVSGMISSPCRQHPRLRGLRGGLRGIG